MRGGSSRARRLQIAPAEHLGTNQDASEAKSLQTTQLMYGGIASIASSAHAAGNTNNNGHELCSVWSSAREQPLLLWLRAMRDGFNSVPEADFLYNLANAFLLQSYLTQNILVLRIVLGTDLGVYLAAHCRSSMLSTENTYL